MKTVDHSAYMTSHPYEQTELGKVFDDAADALEAVGRLAKRELGNDETGFCALGAIRYAASGGGPIRSRDQGPAERMLANRSIFFFQKIISRRRNSHTGVATWSDRPWRTKRGVVKMLRRAAIQARFEGV